ncbi:MFS transporter [Maricaulis sp.]|uniref:MFS transporter n=1 Tax=Maricaulis sp. TaxID=1486257 RepID=UPI00260E75E7|nr:MFS transporter [Maricaulis sp.]
MLNMQKRLSAPFMVLMTLPSTAMGFALAVQISALSWLLRTQFDFEIEEIGLVWAAGPLAGIIGQVIIGMISDKVWFWGGRRRPFILIGGVLSALSLLALPNIGVISTSLGLEGIVAVALVVALTLDLSINVGFNPTRSVIADLTPEGERRTQGYTWMQTVSGSFGVLAYFVGAAMGNIFLIYGGAVLVLLFTLVPPFFMQEPRTLEGTEGEQAAAASSGSDISRLAVATLPLWAVIAYDAYALTLRLMGVERHDFTAEILTLAATAVLIGYVILRRPKAPSATGEDMGEFQKIMAAHAFSWIGVQTMFIYMFAFLEFRIPGVEDDRLGQITSYSFLILNAVAALLPAFVLAPLAKKMRRVRLHAACLAVMAVGYAGGYFLGFSPLAIYLVMALLGVGWAAIVSLPFAIMTQRVSKARTGLYMGIFNLSVVLPQLVASLGVGLAIDRVADKGLVFAIGAVSLAVSAALWLTVKPLVDDGQG